jgi:hypothetical protein
MKAVSFSETSLKAVGQHTIVLFLLLSGGLRASTGPAIRLHLRHIASVRPGDSSVYVTYCHIITTNRHTNGSSPRLRVMCSVTLCRRVNEGVQNRFGAPGVSVVKWGGAASRFGCFAPVRRSPLCRLVGRLVSKEKKYGSCGPETENDCAGECQHRITTV